MLYLVKLFIAIALLPTCHGIELVEPDPYRLSDVAKAIHYDLHFKFDDDYDLTRLFEGEVKIEINFTRPFDSFEIHSTNLNYTSTTFESCTSDSEANCTDIPIKDIISNTTTEKIQFLLESQIDNIEDEFYLTINYDGPLVLNDMNNVGLYLTYMGIVDEQQRSGLMIVSQFQPIFARRAFPCLDEPDQKATFQVSITRPNHLKSASNGRLIETISRNDSLETDIFAITPKMATYTLALIVTDYMQLYNSNMNTTIWTKHECFNNSKYALGLIPKLLKYYENQTQIGYFSTGITRNDHVAVSKHFASAMENWGLATYRDTFLSFDEISYEGIVGSRIIAHETAHMWFGNLITCKWWDFVWIQEAFATIYEYLSLQEITNDDMMPYFYSDILNWCLRNDNTDETLALNYHTNGDLSCIMMKFGDISYRKGALLLFMVKSIVGNENFLDGIREFLRAGSFNSVIDEDLWIAFENTMKNVTLPASLQSVMLTWTDQPGYPIITVNEIDNEPNSVMISQSQSEGKFYIPIWYTTTERLKSSNETTLVWLDPITNPNITLINVLKDESDCIVISMLEGGYYRVEYQGNLWNKLFLTIKSSNYGNINDFNRNRIYDDSIYFNSDEFDGLHALDISKTILKEKKLFTIISALEYLSDLKKMIQEYPHAKKALENYSKVFIKEIYKNLNPVNAIGNNESPMSVQLSLIDLACDFGIEDCIRDVNELYRNYSENNERFQNVELERIVFCNVVRYNKDSDKIWNQLYDISFSLTVLEKVNIFKSLTCTKNSNLRQKLLKRLFENKEVGRVINMNDILWKIMSSFPNGITDFLIFTLNNYDLVIKKYYRNHEVFHHLLRKAAKSIHSEISIGHFKKLSEKIGANALSKSKSVSSPNLMEIAEKNLEHMKNKSAKCYEYFEGSNQGKKMMSAALGTHDTISQFNIFLICFLLCINFASK